MDHERDDRDASLRLLRLAEGLGVAPAIHLAVQAGVADALADGRADGPRPVDELARETGTHPDALFRLLRVLAGAGLFTETEPGRFALTEAGSRLAGNHPQSLRSWVGFQAMLNTVYAAAAYSI